jgi:ankyrin repeat protein
MSDLKRRPIPLHDAARDDDVELATRLIADGADVNQRDADGFTALHFAAQQYSVAVAELLLRHGADVAAENRYGNTPLGTAVYESRGRGDMIRLLLAHGADPDKPNHAGRTPAQLARLIANYPVAQLLEPPADTPKH